MDELDYMTVEELQDYIVSLEDAILNSIGGAGNETFHDLGPRFDRLVEGAF